MKLKDTDELISIWQKNNRVEWSDVAFEVVKELLVERGQVLPEQDKPILFIEENSATNNSSRRAIKSIFDVIKKNRNFFAVFCLLLAIGIFWIVGSNFNTNRIPLYFH